MMPAQAIEDGSVLLRPAADPTDGLALLSWRGDVPDATSAVQVYLDGELYDAAIDPNRRELWLRLPRSRNVTVELLTVPRVELWRDRSDELASWDPAWSSSASLAISRDEDIDDDVVVLATRDGEDEPPHPLWCAGDARSGFGGLFGEGGFGYDDATAPGMGLGEFGVGGFGRDGFAWRWSLRDLSEGDHELSLRIETPSGDPIAVSDTVTACIDRPPDTAATFGAHDNFTLQWTTHED